MKLRGDARAFAEQTFGKADLGDLRRTKRLVDATAALAAHPDSSIPVACEQDGARLEGFYKLIRNPSVTPEAIRDCSFVSTSELGTNCNEDLLLIQDTTSISPVHSLREILRSKKGSPVGYEVHSGMLVSASSGEPLGVLGQLIWCRSEDSILHKNGMTVESEKWQKLDEQIHNQNIDPSRMIRVADRESDMYSYMQFLIANSHRFVLRAKQNRRIKSEENIKEMTHLWDVAQKAPIVGTREVLIEQRGAQANKSLEQKARTARKRRTVMTTLRAIKVSMTGPKGNQKPIDLNIVYVSCENEKLEWLLLTKEPIDNLEQVERIVKHYEHRWLIEQFHKSWKTGCKIEERRMGTEENFLRMMAITMPIAIRLLRLQILANQSEELVSPATKALTNDEIKILWQKVEKGKFPEKMPSCRWAIRAIAKLVGWTDSKRTGRVGLQTLHKGYAKLQNLAEGWAMAQKLNI